MLSPPIKPGPYQNNKNPQKVSLFIGQILCHNGMYWLNRSCLIVPDIASRHVSSMDTVGAVTSVILGCNDYIINILLDLCKVQSMSRRPFMVLSLFDMYRVLLCIYIAKTCKNGSFQQFVVNFYFFFVCF